MMVSYKKTCTHSQSQCTEKTWLSSLLMLVGTHTFFSKSSTVGRQGVASGGVRECNYSPQLSVISSVNTN